MQSKLLIMTTALIVVFLSALVAGVVSYGIVRKMSAYNKAPQSLQMRELGIVDEDGKICMTLSALNRAPRIELRGPSGKTAITIDMNDKGYGAVRILNPDKSGPVGSFEVDDKGAHVKFDRPGGASSYLFLNNSGGSGVILLDPKGTRKLDLMVTPTGETEFRRYDQQPLGSP